MLVRCTNCKSQRVTLKVWRSGAGAKRGNNIRGRARYRMQQVTANRRMRVYIDCPAACASLQGWPSPMTVMRMRHGARRCFCDGLCSPLTPSLALVKCGLVHGQTLEDGLLSASLYGDLAAYASLWRSHPGVHRRRLSQRVGHILSECCHRLPEGPARSGACGSICLNTGKTHQV